MASGVDQDAVAAPAGAAAPPPDRAPPYSLLAPSYDLAVGLRDFSQARRAFERLVSALGLRFRSAVDLGCGTGLFACYLARRWCVPVIGVDRSPAMLAVARGRCRDPRVTFLLQDLRALRLPCPVELATANTFTLNHLMSAGELLGAFRRVAAALRPGGHLVFDLITDRQPWRPGRWHRQRLRLPGGELDHRLRWDPGPRLLRIEVVHRWWGGPPPRLELYVGRGWSPVQVGELLRRAGLGLRGVFEADGPLRLASAGAPRVLIVARRPR